MVKFLQSKFIPVYLFKIVASFCIWFNLQNTYSQNELYLNGTDYFYNNGDLIYVNGEINNNDAFFTNTINGSYTGTIELTGNWTNTITTNKYTSTGIEKFSGTANQLISGTWNGTSGNENQFYNFKINKTTGYVSLAQNTNVNVNGTVAFESTGGIIRTATSSSTNTGDYSNYLYLQNPSTTAFTGYNWPSGTSKYIEGKLKRQVNSATTYQFPIGFQPTDKDGMEPFLLSFNTTPTNTGIVGYIRPATVNVLHQNILCDVGTDPGAGSQQFPLCAGPKDGIYDMYYLDQNLSHEWMVTPDNATTYNYDITLFPGNNLDNLSYYTMPAACDAAYNGKRIRVIGKDGVIGGSEQAGAGNYAPFAQLTSYIWCDFDNNTLANQTSFSSFRIFGTSNSSYTTLPVELTTFTLTPKDNIYFQLDWTTASEKNNAGFDIERSEDAMRFTKIGWMDGNGTTSIPHSYQFNDQNVEPNKDYYYRLKQKDKDNKFSYSNIIKGRLTGEQSFTISSIYPNPTNSESTIDIYIPEATNIQVTLINVLGQQLPTINYELKAGFNKIKLNASTLPAGTYLLSFKYRETIFTKKLIKN